MHLDRLSVKIGQSAAVAELGLMIAAVAEWQTCLPAGRRARFEMFYVYALSSLIKNYIYIGLTDNVERRIKQHQLGRELTTRPYKPFRELFVEHFGTRAEARQREKYLKSGIGKEWIKKNFFGK